LKPSAPLEQNPALYPEFIGSRETADGIILSLCIPQNLAYFSGHFEQVPIVPGVVQIQWAVHYAQRYLGLQAVFSHMEAVKFKELLLPDQHFELSLRYPPRACKLEFRYHSETREYSSGRIYFHDLSV
jgi:3-hydroxymyristoyl/3-hydroxydecanoyl-(acyl carrier protein) dehydratase